MASLADQVEELEEDYQESRLVQLMIHQGLDPYTKVYE